MRIGFKIHRAVIALSTAFLWTAVCVAGPGDELRTNSDSPPPVTAIVAVDLDGYFPGETVHINGAGFFSGERVTVRAFVLSSDSISQTTLKQWVAQADVSGDFATTWTLPPSVGRGEKVLLDAHGIGSGLLVSTSFSSRNTRLLLTSSINDSVCIDIVSDSILFCARLTERCEDGLEFPLADRPIRFKVNSGDCESFLGRSPDDDDTVGVRTALTNSFGIACIRVAIPGSLQAITVKAKFKHEDKPENCPPTGNTLCPPDHRRDDDDCVNLSSAKACLSVLVGGDLDVDGVSDSLDNCVCAFNPLQEDFDGDGMGDSCFMPQYLRPLTVRIRAFPFSLDSLGNPVDPELNLIVTDPDSLKIGADSLDVLRNDFDTGAAYFNLAGNDSIVIDNPKSGDYLIEIIPEAGFAPALPVALASKYVVSVRTDGTVENNSPILTAPSSGFIDTLGFESVPYTFGDANGDRVVDLADAMFLIGRIFNGGPPPSPVDAGDADCNGNVDIRDVTSLLHHIFALGPEPGCP